MKYQSQPLSFLRVSSITFRIAASLLLLLTVGCASRESTLHQQEIAFPSNGSFTIARPAPAPSQSATQVMLGLLPGSIPSLTSPIDSAASAQGRRIKISRKTSSVQLFDGEELLVSCRAEGLDALTPGKFSLLLKQRNPLWYAPESYFESRQLQVPPPGDRARFRRGALGDFVLFLDKETPLHTGPIWSSDIGGVRFEENDLGRIYYQVEVGTQIEVE